MSPNADSNGGQAATDRMGIIFEIIDEVLARGRENDILKQLAQLKDVLYDRKAVLEPPSVKLDLVHGEFGGNLLGADHVDWIDIVFISDNYTASNINEFHAAVDVATDKLTKVSGDPSSALFVAHQSVLRTWKLPLVRSGATSAERLIGSANRPGGGTVTSLANLHDLQRPGCSLKTPLEASFRNRRGWRSLPSS